MYTMSGRITVLYMDQHIAVISKPCGLLSVPAPGRKEKSAQGILESLMRRSGCYSARHRPFAVHRLDRYTSGVLLFALNEAAQQKIMGSWHGMVKSRLYRAVSENPRRNPLPQSGIISAPLELNAYNQGYVPKSGGRISARTHFAVIERGKVYTLFELELDTGRKNQIRAHLASKGYPIAGDKSHNARTNPFERLALHARTLSFLHPYNDKELRFEVEEPGDWLKTVRETHSAQTHAPRPADRRPQRRESAHNDFISAGTHRKK